MNSLHIAGRIFKQTIRDVRTLALLLIAPILILSLLYYIFTVADNTNGVTVGVHDVPDSLITELHDKDIHVKHYNNNDDINDKIKDDKLTGFLHSDGHKISVTYANDNPTQAGELTGANQKWLMSHNMNAMKDNTNKLHQALTKIQQKMPGDGGNTTHQDMAKPYKLTAHYLYGSSNSTYFDMINPILIGFFVFFFTFLISGIGLLKERTSGTLERLLASPIKRSEIIFGYVFGYGSFSVIQTVVVVLYAIYILHINLVGSIWFVLLTAILTALVAVTFGILLSTFASSEFQMIQFIPLVVVPQVLFAGIIPIESMNKGLQYFSHIMPLFYTGQTMQNIMIKGYEFNDIYIYLIVLFAFFICLLILNIIGMKRYRKV